MDEVLQGEADAYRRGDMQVVEHWATFARVMGLIKWGSLFLAVFLTFFVIWLCTPASLFPSLVLAGIVAIAGGVFLARGGGH